MFYAPTTLLLVLLTITKTTQEKDNSCVRFTSKNYLAWKFQFKMYVKGKGLWGHLDGKTQPPKEEAAFTT